VHPKGCAYVPTTEAWLRATGQWKGRTSPLPGDIAIFNWDGGVSDHAGLVERVLDDARFASIEGNSGNQVARREHAIDDAVGFGRVRAYIAAAEASYT
jgi:hypothetical protein